MKNKKIIILATLLAMFSIGINSASANSLTQMDIKKSSVADTVDVTFYTTEINPNTVVTKKSNNRYVVLMPNVSSNSSVTPNFGGLKDLITDVNVKHVDDGIGGYTKVTFETTKPLNIKTHNVKAAPLTQAQKDAKTIIAQNNTTPAATSTKPAETKSAASTTTQKPATTQTKPAVTQQTKPASVDTSKTNTPKATVTTVPKTTITKPVETKPTKQTTTQPKTELPKVKTAKNDFIDSNYNPKMKFDKDGNRKVNLEPRVSHPVEKTSAVKPSNSEVSTDNVIETDNVLDTDNILETGIPEIDSAPAQENNSKLPLFALIGGAVAGLGGLYLLLDALAHKSQKNTARNNSFLSLSAQNQAKRQRREYYDIANNKDLSWQEKYKLYTKKEQEYSPVVEDDASYVTNLGASKKAIIMPKEQAKPVKLTHVKKQSKSHNDIVREKLQAKISQMEHSLAQTPTVNEPVETPKGVQSEDNSIMNTMKNIKLKSFSKPVSLKETNRSLADNPFSNKSSYREGQHVNLRDSELSVNKRSSSSPFNIRNMIDSGNKYLTNNGETNMKKQKENYLTSSLDEYLSILDSEGSSTATATDTLSQIRSTSTPDSVSRSGVSNPISRSKESSLSTFHGGMIVRSGYNIDSDRGIYLVNIDGVSALVGKIKDSITILKKFNQVLDKPLQVRPENDNVYIARVGNYKCLVDVAKDKMGTLIEI